MNSQSRLAIVLNNNNPVEVEDFSKSMCAIGNEYRRFLSNGENAASPNDVRLYIKDVRSGSIEVDLVAFAPVAIQFAEHANTVIDFAKYLKSFIDWYTGKSNEEPAKDKKTLNNLSSVLEPTAKDKSSQLNIGAYNHNGDVVINVSLNDVEASAIQNRISKDIALMKEPIAGLRQKVVMHWAQARNEASSKGGDKAKIESISDKSVKVIFGSDDLKARMLFDEPYPFRHAYVVDVMVETIDGKPCLYKITNIYEKIEDV